MRFCFFFLTLLGATSLAQADLLTLSPSSQKLEEVTLAKAAQAQIGGQSESLTEVGSGLRSKKVLFIHVKVYVGELFVNDPSTFQKSSALASLQKQKSGAVRMTFLRDVDLGRLETSFKESFEVNKVDLKNPQITQFLDAIHRGGDIKKGQSITIAFAKKDKTDLIVYENGKGESSEITGEGLIEKIYALWLGQTADSGVSDFQKSLLQ